MTLLAVGAAASGLAAWRRRRARVLRGATMAALAAGAAAASQAAEPGWYAGVGVGHMNARASDTDLVNALSSKGYEAQVSFDGSDGGSKLFGGYRLNRYAAIEAAYLDLGSTKSTTTTTADDLSALTTEVARVHPISITGTAVSAVGTWPLGNFFVMGKVGVMRWSAKAEGRLLPSGLPYRSEDLSGVDVTYGVGAGYDIGTTGWTVRAEWERFNTQRNNPEFVSVSLVYRF